MSNDGRDFDVIVLGGGTAGIAAVLEGVRLGAKVALVDSNPLGPGGRRAHGPAAFLEHLAQCFAPLIKESNDQNTPILSESQLMTSWKELASSRAAHLDAIVRKSGATLFRFRGLVAKPSDVVLLDPQSGDERLVIHAPAIVIATGRPQPEITGKNLESRLNQVCNAGRLPESWTEEFPSSPLAVNSQTLFESAGIAQPNPAPPVNQSSWTDWLSQHLPAWRFCSPGSQTAISKLLSDCPGLPWPQIQERPPNTNLDSTLLGLRKLGVRPLADGRLPLEKGSFKLPADHPRLYAAGAAAADSRNPATLCWTLGNSAEEGRSAIRECLGQKVLRERRAPGAIISLPLGSLGWVGKSAIFASELAQWFRVVSPEPLPHAYARWVIIDRSTQTVLGAIATGHPAFLRSYLLPMADAFVSERTVDQVLPTAGGHENWLGLVEEPFVYRPRA